MRSGSTACGDGARGRLSRCARGRVAPVAALLWAAWAGGAAAAAASEPDPNAALATLAGERIASVRIERDGEALADADVRALLQTRPGQPLELAAVRQSLLHLLRLGRFEDVRVEAEAGAAGVRLTYRVAPMRAIATVRFTGSLGLSESRLREAIEDRLGPSPSARRIEDAIGALGELYADHGYLQSSIDTRVEPARRGEALALVFVIESGMRARVGEISVEGDPPGPIPKLLREIGLASGRPFDREAIDERLSAWVGRLRTRRHYEAAVALGTRPRPDLSIIDVALDVRPGPRITLRFTGDRLPADAERDLVPLEREGAADEDLLEDSKRRIEAYLRQRGYWRAEADYARTPRGDDLDIVFTVRRGRAYVTDRVTFEGRGAIEESQLRSLVTVAAGQPFVASAVDEAARAIEAHYHARGYVAARVGVRADDVTPSNGPRGSPGLVEVVFAVAEGPHTTTGAVRIAGAERLTDAELVELLSAKPGAPFSAARVAADRDALQRRYLDRGFRHARVEPVLARRGDAHVLDVTYAVEEGPQTLVDHILIIGNTRTSAETILREVTLEPGGPLGYADVVESQRQLAALGLFRSVRITDAGDVGRTRRDVLIRVEEAPATTIGYGAGIEAGERLRRVAADEGSVSTRLEFAGRGFFEIGRRHLWGKDRAVNLFMRASMRPRDAPDDPARDGRGLAFNEYRVVGTYREPRVVGLGANLDLLGFGEQAIRSSFSFRRAGMRADLSERITPRLTIIGRYGLGRTELFDVRVAPEDQITVDRLFPQVRLSSVSLSVINDTRNDPLDPTAGALVSVDGDLSARLLGSEVGFVKGFWQGFVYRRLPQTDRTVLALGARFGVAEGFRRSVPRVDEGGEILTGADGDVLHEEVRDLPLSERFFAGGDTTVRGFTLDRLGVPSTLDRNGFPTGGNALLVLNAELRFPVWRAFGGVLFTDAGNVFRRATELALDQIRGSVGIGLRYRSPIGPLRVDWGFKLDRREFQSGELEDRSAWHVSIGQAF